MFVVETFIVVNKRVMRSSEDQPKVNSSSDVHRWHALWHALSDIAGKAGPKNRGAGYKNESDRRMRLTGLRTASVEISTWKCSYAPCLLARARSSGSVPRAAVIR